jgi:hypothetical protein
MMRLLLLAAILTLAVPSAAWAKKINIEWKPIPGATQYEIQVQRDGKAVAHKKLEDPAWSGSLDPGFYVYQVRAYDRIKRAGKWTDALPLVVMPPPPEPSFPSDGKKVVLFNPDASTTLKWSPVKGASEYVLELKRDGKVVSSQRMKDSQATLKALPSGDYSWQVTAVVGASGRVPAAFQSRKWQSKPSDASEFRIEHRTLEAPVPVQPIGSITPSTDGQVKFKWKKVDGAEAYELEVIPYDAKSRVPASAVPVSKLTSTDNVAIVSLPREGQYRWRVRALANVGEKRAAEATGAQSTADFKLDRNAAFFEGSGYVALSTMLAPYTYQVISPMASANGTAGSSAVTVRGSGEYWFHPQWGAAIAGEGTQFQIGKDSYLRKGFEGVVKYRLNFGSAKYNWSLSPKFGVEERDYFEIFPNSTAASTLSSTVLGAQLGVDLRKQLSDRFSVGVKLAYFKPLIISSSQAGPLTSDASNRNISVGAQVLYWLDRHWGLGAGAYVEHRSISYTVQGAPSTQAAEQVFMDGTYFFGSVIYSFGR